MGKLYRVSKNESGYLLWIPKRLADEVGIKSGDRVALLSDGSMIVVLPEGRMTGRLEVGGVDEVRDTR